MSTSTLRGNRSTKTARRQATRTLLRVCELERRLTPTVTLPGFASLSHPASNPMLPWAAFASELTLTAQPSSAAIGEWTRTGGPNQTIALTGDSFSVYSGDGAGSDSEFLVYGRTTSSTITAPGDVLRLDGARAAVTLPDELLENSMYLMWPHNADGYGRPVAINKAETTWVGPNVASAGDKVSVYGRNLDFTNEVGIVYVESATSNPAYHDTVTINSTNPYQVTFTLPSTWPAGPYNVWVHNGHGGEYGWSETVALTIRNPLPTSSSPPVSTNADTFSVTDGTKLSNPATINDNSNDDWKGILEAIQHATAYVDDPANAGKGATVFFPAGTYNIATAISLFNVHDIRFEGALSGSTPTSIIEPMSKTVGNAQVYPSTLFVSDNFEENLEFRNLVLQDAGNLRFDDAIYPTLVRLRGGQGNEADITFNNVRFITEAYRLFPIDANNLERVTVQDCKFVASGFSDFTGSTQVRVDNCKFYGRHNVQYMLGFQGSGEVSVTNCVAQDQDSTATTVEGHAIGRFIWAQGDFNENFYIGKNTTIDFAPDPSLRGTISYDPDNTYLNSGEQICFEASGPKYYGTPINADSEEVQFGDLTVNYLATFTRLSASIIDGKGIGQRRSVTALNKSTGTITVSPPWTIVPDSTSKIALAGAQQNVVIYDNILDGKEIWMTPSLLGDAKTKTDRVHVASDALQIGGTAHLIVVKNTISDVRNGIYMIPRQRVTTGTSGIDPRPHFDTDFFDYFTDNTITNAVNGISLAVGPDPYASGFAAAGYGSPQLGTTVRNNTFALMKRIYQQVNQPRSDIIGTGTHLQYRATDLTIIEDNKYPAVSGRTEADGLIGVGMFGYHSSTAYNTVIRRNVFDGLNKLATGVDFAVGGTPALFDNDWGSATKYSGLYTPGSVLEVPRRVVSLTWDALNQELTGDTFVPLRNAGSGATTDLVFAHSDSSWVSVTTTSFPGGEVGDGQQYLDFDFDSLSVGLGDGIYTANITVVDGSHSIPFTVVMTVEGQPDLGPSAIELPTIRRDSIATIETENMDRGDNGFYDPNSLTHVGAFGSGYAIVNAPENDWYNYTINVAADGWYRAELRYYGATAGQRFTLDIGGTQLDFFSVVTSSGYATLRPTAASTEEFVYLNYNVQTCLLTIADASDDFVLDWIRFLPVDNKTQSGLPLPHPSLIPTISRLGATVLEAEHFDKGGLGVGNSETVAGNALSQFRDEDGFNIAEFGTGNQQHAIRGFEGEWVLYTFDVVQPGPYQLEFKASNVDGTGTIAISDAGNNQLAPDLDIPDTDDYLTWTNAYATVKFDSPGRKTIKITFLANSASNDTAQIDSIRITPANMSLAGEAAPTATPLGLPNYKQVGTAFAVNTWGEISALRFFAHDDEASSTGTHTLRLYRIGTSTHVGNGNVTFGDLTQVGADSILTSIVSGWNTVALAASSTSTDPLIAPGLYMVTVNVLTQYSFSDISYLGAAGPSVLTTVAGTKTAATNAPAPNEVFSGGGHSDGFFWVDVLFSPIFN